MLVVAARLNTEDERLAYNESDKLVSDAISTRNPCVSPAFDWSISTAISQVISLRPAPFEKEQSHFFYLLDSYESGGLSLPLNTVF